MDEKMNQTINRSQEVISFVENDINWFQIESIINKSLVTKKVKKSLKQLSKSLEIIINFEIKENNYLITICDENKDKVIETDMKLNKLFESVVKQTQTQRQRPFTHLITVPFNSEPLRQEFSRFRDNVLKECKGMEGKEGMAESLFQKPYKLHLTFFVLVLENQNQICFAKQLLRQSMDQIIKPLLKGQPLKVTIEGLDCFKGSPERAHVVYAQIKDHSNRLQSIADRMVAKFVESGLLEDNNQNKVKLHITFMNSLFRQRILSKNIVSETESKKRIKRVSFDAKNIIKSYKSYTFGHSVVESIQLNDIKTKTEEGFYGLVDGIDLPKE